MTFADLYHLNDKCKKVKEKLYSAQPYTDEDGNLTLETTISTYEDIKDIIDDCKSLIFDLCQTDIKDVIKNDS